MEIVINIPDRIHYGIDKGITVNGSEASQIVLDAVKNGTPLPKRHGRLVDADALEYTCNYDECGMLTGCNHCQYHIITEDEIDDAQTIIEAEKGAE